MVLLMAIILLGYGAIGVAIGVMNVFNKMTFNVIRAMTPLRERISFIMGMIIGCFLLAAIWPIEVILNCLNDKHNGAPEA